MRESAGAQAIAAESFSAAAFFAASASGAMSECAGSVRTELQIPSPNGLLVSDAPSSGTLAWVDGLAQNVCAAQEMIDLLLRGGLPRPLNQQGRVPGNLHIHFFDAQKLAHSHSTLLSLFGLHEPLEGAFAKANVAECPHCSADARIFRRPHEIGAEILQALAGHTAVLFFESNSEDLFRWAEQSGFDSNADNSAPISVRIDSGTVDEGMIVALMPALQSAWRVPGLSVLAESGSSRLRCAPHGACASCGTLLAPTNRSRISALLSHGVDSSTTVFGELGLKVGGMSLRRVLSLPCGTALLPKDLEEIIPASLRACMHSVGLDGYQLGTRTSELASPVLAIVTALATLLPQHGLALIDLPHGLIPPDTARRLEDMIAQRAALAPTVLVGRGPVAQPHIVERWPDSQQTGEPLATLQLPGSAQRAYRGVSTIPLVLPDNAPLLNAPRDLVVPIAPASFASIRVFDSFSLKQKTVIEELGLFEPLAQLVASSLDARAFGLRAKDLALRTRSKSGFACPRCSGLGVLLDSVTGLERPRASRCNSCDGARFCGGAEKLLFRGFSMGQILNSSFSALDQVLQTLRRSTLTLNLLELLDLQHLQLGMPLSLLGFSERRRMQMLSAAIAGHSAKAPRVVLVELPFAGLSERHAHAVETLLRTPEYAPHVAWVIQTSQGRSSKAPKA